MTFNFSEVHNVPGEQVTAAKRKRKSRKRKSRKRQKRHLYVIRLKKTVLDEPRFRRANPDHNGKKLCLYVGLSSHPPEVRLEQHLSGVRSSRIVKRYGKNVFREKCQVTRAAYEKAQQKERDLAKRLRAEGYAVWQN